MMPLSLSLESIEALDRHIADLKRKLGPSQGPFYTVPWMPGMELYQLDKFTHLELEVSAACWQLGMLKGFGADEVHTFIREKMPRSDPAHTALVLGMIEEGMTWLAERQWKKSAAELRAQPKGNVT